jgi:diguanylate cyclase (GGDEF)-like protein
VTVVPGPDANPAWFAVSAQDITERRRAEEELRSLTATLTERAIRDQLTGLANRTLLEERLRAALSRDGRTGGSTAVLFLDLDGFKAVNDRYGHAAGDRVLQTVAKRLAAAVRPSDTVARVGGDEFVVLVEGATDEGVARLAERLRDAVGEPLPTLDLKVGVSVGVAVSTAGETEPMKLLQAADKAMYAIKGAGRGPRPAGASG